MARGFFSLYGEGLEGSRFGMWQRTSHISFQREEGQNIG
jgi:hypothetical protein